MLGKSSDPGGRSSNSNQGREKMATQPVCLATGGMDSSFARRGAAQGWGWSGRFIASACATMLIVAAGVSFSGSETARQELSSRRNRYGVRLPLQPLRPLRRTRRTESQA